MPALAILWPIAGNLPVTNDSDAHLARGSGEAVDFAAWSGTEWLSCAPKTARVVKSGYDSECGYHIYLQWHDPETDWLLRARYCHGLMAPPWGVSALVEPGECVGFVGATGIATGPHLHFALERWTGQVWERLRPEEWLQASASSDAVPSDAPSVPESASIPLEGEAADTHSQPGESDSQPQLGGEMNADEKAEALALLDILFGCARVLASEQTAPDTLVSLGEQGKSAVLRLKELVE